MTGETTSGLARWRCPVDLSRYDRTPELSEAERTALHQCCDRLMRSRNPWCQVTRVTLERLMVPIREALQAVNARPAACRRTVNALLKEMHRRQSSYWVWQPADWYTVLQSHFPAGEQRKAGVVDLMAVAYLLAGLRQFRACGRVHHSVLAKRLFGTDYVEAAFAPVFDHLRRWGYADSEAKHLRYALTALLLDNGSPHLEDLTLADMAAYREQHLPAYLQRYAVRISKVLHELGYLKQALPRLTHDPRQPATTRAGVHPDWLDWCDRWLTTTTLSPKTRQGYYYGLLGTGRWLMQFHPSVTSPMHWTRDLAAEYVASVQQRRIGDYGTANVRLGAQAGQPWKPSSQRNHLLTLRTFFRDCLEWEWIPLRFDPQRYFALPYRDRVPARPQPRVIADDLWAKLLWAGLNLTPQDIPVALRGDGQAWRDPAFPFEMVRALALVWLFTGLRRDEIRRLRVGCIRWQGSAAAEENPNDICLLEVPVNKTSGAFTKPVAALAGKAIAAWERLRPEQPRQLDPKTNERVNYLFAYRGTRLGRDHVNRVLIPLLCQKAGIPGEDVRGRITSHRARSTIASQLANAREPMTLLELMQWLGHTSPKATLHYVKLTPNHLTKAYTEAGYFDRNLRTIRVLLDQESIRSGAAGSGTTWKYYDLGHGYCSYDFFDQCPHRMACAKCSFYIPKTSSAAGILEAKANLQHLLQVIPLTEEEVAAVEDGLTALERLQLRLVDIPTPAGPTPRQMTAAVIHPDDIR